MKQLRMQLGLRDSQYPSVGAYSILSAALMIKQCLVKVRIGISKQ